MRSLMFTAAIIVICHQFAAQADDRKYPYQAIVELEGEYVRSGPGPSFYPTDKLRKGDKVTVHRHDPGGWCMISPPQGSFSWIKAEHVQRSGENGGILKANNVVVHVGSSLSTEEFTTIQGNLSRGEAVQILGEKNFPFDDGPKLMYKIAPVRREWRWIQRKAIVAADAIQSEPFPGEATPRKKNGPIADQEKLDPNAFGQPISTGDTVTGPDRSESMTQKPRATIGNAAGSTDTGIFADKLSIVDAQFREMIKQDPSTWDLKDIQQQYLQLDNEATQPLQSKTIAQRLDAITRYQKTQADYMGFLKLSEAARQKDAQLAAVQRDAEQLANGGGPAATAPGTGPTPITSQPGEAVASAGDPSRPPVAPTQPTPQPGAPNAPKFAGAGMVVSMSQSFPGGPQFALTAPGGKLLCYLVPSAGVDLRKAVNQSMGVTGDRSFRQEWGADVIIVRGLQPVQLRAASR